MMKSHLVAAGIFVLSALMLITIALFLIGDRHNAFQRHVDFYTEMANVNDIVPGSKVRVSGMDAGQVTNIAIPSHPSGKFRLRLQVNTKLHDLIRDDSVVTIETDGLVGDRFLLIHQGSDPSGIAAGGATLRSKEPIELSAVIATATGMLDQTAAVIGDLQHRTDGALDAITATVNNTNGLVTGVRQGRGTVGMLLTDRKTADSVRAAVGNTQQATANLNQASLQARQLMTDFQQRNLFQKAEDTLNNTKDASQQIAQASHQLNVTLDDALGPDRSGENAAANMRETLSNINLATANMAEDTEALKHEFFFRGFFKKRGYYSLNSLTGDEYRTSAYFQNPANRRVWMAGSQTFVNDASGHEVLSAVGELQLDDAMGAAKDRATTEPIVVEGYSQAPAASDQMVASRARSLLVAHYLEKRFHLSNRDVAVMALDETAPRSSGKANWDGICLVFLQPTGKNR